MICLNLRRPRAKVPPPIRRYKAALDWAGILTSCVMGLHEALPRACNPDAPWSAVGHAVKFARMSAGAVHVLEKME